MKIKIFYRKHKIKVIRYAGIALIVIGLAVIIWPFYTNFVMVRREMEILSSWDEEIEAVLDKDAGEANKKLEKENIPVDTEKKIPFRITIPEIEIDWIVKKGTDYATLKKGPGHYTSSALPGENGTCLVAGHRTTYGAPFNRLDELEEGDEIIIETEGNEKFIYLVTGQESALPTDMTVLENTEYPSLVLSTCHPKFYATRRLIIYARILENSDPGETTGD
jgi:sortase A